MGRWSVGGCSGLADHAGGGSGVACRSAPRAHGCAHDGLVHVSINASPLHLRGAGAGSIVASCRVDCADDGGSAGVSNSGPSAAAASHPAEPAAPSPAVAAPTHAAATAAGATAAAIAAATATTVASASTAPTNEHAPFSVASAASTAIAPAALTPTPNAAPHAPAYRPSRTAVAAPTRTGWGVVHRARVPRMVRRPRGVGARGPEPSCTGHRVRVATRARRPVALCECRPRRRRCGRSAINSTDPATVIAAATAATPAIATATHAARIAGPAAPSPAVATAARATRVVYFGPAFEPRHPSAVGASLHRLDPRPSLPAPSCLSTQARGCAGAARAVGQHSGERLHV